MTDIVATDPASALAAAVDPAEFVVTCLERGKSWLAEALEHGDLEQIASVKGWAATLRTATMQKQLGKDAEIAATELVRRAERAIGLGIRAGQEAGEVLRPGERARPANQYGPTAARNVVTSSSPKDFVPEGGRTAVEIYALTDNVSDEQFEEALAEAKEEGNLSRANVARHVKAKGKPTDDKLQIARELADTGHTTTQIATHLGYSREGMRNFLGRHGIEVPADAVVGKQRNLDSTRIVAATVDTVNGIGMLFDRIDFGALDPADVDGWLPVLNESIRSLTTLRNRLKEVASHE